MSTIRNEWDTLLSAGTNLSNTNLADCRDDNCISNNGKTYKQLSYSFNTLIHLLKGYYTSPHQSPSLLSGEDKLPSELSFPI